MAKTEVYSWRVSPTTKAALERAAKRSNLSLGSILDRAVAEWLVAADRLNRNEAEEQELLHRAVSTTIGVLNGGNRFRAEQARQTIRARLSNRDARQRTD